MSRLGRLGLLLGGPLAGAALIVGFSYLAIGVVLASGDRLAHAISTDAVAFGWLPLTLGFLWALCVWSVRPRRNRRDERTFMLVAIILGGGGGYALFAWLRVLINQSIRDFSFP